MKALIRYGVVIDTAEVPFPIPTGAEWIDCPDDCTIGWAYNNSQFFPPVEQVQTLEEAKAARLSELNAAFTTESKTAHCMSSAGFEIDADETANRNIEGLALVLKPGESTLFRAYDNSFHEVTKEQLETMRKEIVVNSQWLYQEKWTLEAAIVAAETVDELDAINITFNAVTHEEGGGNEQTA